MTRLGDSRPRGLTHHATASDQAAARHAPPRRFPLTARRLVCLIVFGLIPLSAGTASASASGANGRIVFTSTRDGSSTYELYSAAADGSDAKRLTWTDGTEQSPAWSPDSSQIAYEGSFAGRFRIFVMDSSGNDQKLAFASTRPDNNSGWHIWIMNADGSGLHELNPDWGTNPAWSPDGSQIAYVGLNGIAVANPDGSAAHSLLAQPTSRYDE